MATDRISQTGPARVASPRLARSSARPAIAGRLRRPLRRVWPFRLLVLTLIAAGQELLFRCEFPFPEVSGFNRISYQMMAQSHPGLRPMLRRGLVYDRLLVASQADGFAETHGLNLYGFRGPDFAIRPPRDGRRILLIGDSVTEGIGASDSATIARQLERGLARDGERAEVINLGVIAATLDHLTVLARDAIPLLRPTVVILILYANDLPANPYNSLYDLPGPGFPRWPERWWMPRALTLLERVSMMRPIYRRWPHVPIPFFTPVPDRTNPWHDSAGPAGGLDPELYREMVRGRLNPWLNAQSTDIPKQLGHDFSGGGSPRRHLMRVAEVCRSAGARLLVAYVPFCGVVGPRYAESLIRLGMNPTTASALSRDPAYRRQNCLLARVCSELELPLADTTEALVRAEQAGVAQYWEYDTHPRPAGYATIAGRIHRAIPPAAQ